MHYNQPEVMTSVFESINQIYDQDYQGITLPHFYDSVTRAPLRRLPASDITLKMENHQHTRAFKQRGAFVAGSLAVKDNEWLETLTTNSAGNHALGVAAFTRWYNLNRMDGPRLKPYIYMAKSASAAKKMRLRKIGAEVIDAFGSLEDAGHAAIAHAASKSNTHFIHPFEDPRVIAGQSTSFAESVADLEATGLLNPHIPLRAFAGCGGGGEVVGMASLMHIYKQTGRLHEDSQVIAVQEHYTDAMTRRMSLEALELPIPRDLFTEVDGTDQFHVQNDGTAVRTVSENNITRAKWLAEQGDLRFMRVPSAMIGRVIMEGLTMKETIEPAGALGYAGLLLEEGQRRLQSFSSGTTLKMAMVTGGNLTQQTRDYYLQEYWTAQYDRNEFFAGRSLQYTLQQVVDPYNAVLERAGIPIPA